MPMSHVFLELKINVALNCTVCFVYLFVYSINNMLPNHFYNQNAVKNLI